MFVYCRGEELNAPFVLVYKCIYIDNDYDFDSPVYEENQQKCEIIKGEWQ